VENWVLQHGGSLLEAAQSFAEAARGRSFKEFCDVYTVFDAGQDYYRLRSGDYAHDNFVRQNMDAAGYTRMVRLCNSIVANARR
jgi:hypothetical protein